MSSDTTAPNWIVGNDEHGATHYLNRSLIETVFHSPYNQGWYAQIAGYDYRIREVDAKEITKVVTPDAADSVG